MFKVEYFAPWRRYKSSKKFGKALGDPIEMFTTVKISAEDLFQMVLSRTQSNVCTLSVQVQVLDKTEVKEHEKKKLFLK